MEELPKRNTQHLTTLVEDSLDDTTEELFVAVESRRGIARHADDSALHLGRRIEDVLVDSKQIFHIVPRLNEDRENAVGLISGL